MISFRRFFCCLLISAPLVCAAGASGHDDVAGKLKGKVVFLRGMELGRKLTFDAKGNVVGDATAGPFAYSAVKVEGIHGSRTAVEIKGRRVALVFQTPSPSLPLSTKNLRFVPLKEPVKISIATDSSDPQALEAALNQVFATTAESALAGKTQEEQQAELSTIGSTASIDAYQPKNLVQSSEITKLTHPQNGVKITRLTPIAPSGAPIALESGTSADGGTSNPILISSANPNYTDEARKKRISGFCVLSVIVDPSGYPTHIRLARSADPGLDAEAMIAVSQYRFKPGRLRGEVVPVLIRVMVNFRIY
jgi:TonB family protein